MQTKQKVAIVTGGASGLGLAIARKFVTSGILTIIIGRNEKKLQSAQETLGELCVPCVFDLSRRGGIPSLIDRIRKDHGRIDILVNNAGIHLKKPLVAVTDEEFQEVIATNLLSVFSMSREVSKVMTEQGSGSILQISSMAAQYGMPLVIAYTAAKSGVEGMTRAMAVELSPGGVRVNCIAPGFITTAMSSGAMDNDPERKQRALGRTPMGAFGKPEDIAEAAYFLTSDAAKYVTGTVLPVDGGNAIGF
ncbi:MAG TPA: SDR family NAD(P)-dependent oxidoreductase [Chitinophagaceae bacterium]|nr:SDR family NAD(P)-dependent oxidoreductase [Chitinophagaceae bacterium]